MNVILHEWPPHSGLPTLTPACLQAEAYLRFSRTEFCIETHTSASASPAGVLPALEQASEIAPSQQPDDLAAAQAIIEHLKQHDLNIDTSLTAAQRADAMAFANLIHGKLDPATQYTTWCETRGFKEFRKAAYSSQPFPLSWIVPWTQQRGMAKQLQNIDGFQAYQDAVETLAAIANRLRASTGPFFFGNAPSSVDALLFGHLAFYRHSPIAAPILREKVGGQRVLCEFVDTVMREYFSREMPSPPALDDASAWSEAGQGHGARPKRAPTVEESRMWRGSQLWLGGVAAAIGAYVVFGGHYVQFVTVQDDDGDDGEVEDDDDDVQG
eukprot:jgi/Chrzof1/592/Cz01g21160.t1